jgi:hypothetical protein
MLQIQRVSLWIGIALILITGLIHVIGAKHSFREAAYLGWLFWANGAGSFGLPYLPPQPHAWLYPLGVASLLVEGLFMAVFYFERKNL